MSRTWEFTLPLHTPLSMNDRQHWAPKSSAVRIVRHASKRLAQQAKIPQGLERIAVELHYAPTVRRRRDPLNLVATLKPVEDGLVDAGVVPDDTPHWVEPTMPVIDEPIGGRFGRLYVVVRELSPHPYEDARSHP